MWRRSLRSVAAAAASAPAVFVDETTTVICQGFTGKAVGLAWLGLAK